MRGEGRGRAGGRGRGRGGGVVSPERFRIVSLGTKVTVAEEFPMINFSSF